MLSRICRDVITTKIFQTVFEVRQNRAHHLLYTGPMPAELCFNIRLVYGTIVANAPGDFGQQRSRTRLIRMAHVGMKRPLTESTRIEWCLTPLRKSKMTRLTLWRFYHSASSTNYAVVRLHGAACSIHQSALARVCHPDKSCLPCMQASASSPWRRATIFLNDAASILAWRKHND